MSNAIETRNAEREAKGTRARFGWTVPVTLLAAGACMQNTGKAPNIEHVKPLANANVGMGFDPGIDLTAAGALEAETAVAGALIPGPTGMPGRRIAFYAFASDVGADMLDRALAMPTDGNADADVFLAAVVDTRVEVNGEPQPSAFNQAMLNAFRNTRCMRCHSFHFDGGFGAPGTTHPGGESQQNNDICRNCHDIDIGVGEQGELTEWRAPLLAVEGEITFGSKTATELCTQVKTNVADPVDHFGNDSRIFWAMESGILPTGELAAGGPVPFRKAHFDELVEAWVGGGCECTTAAAVKDVSLVSRASAGTAAANGASRRPSIAFAHNPAFDPDNLGATKLVGWVYVAFESAATDLTAGFVNNNGASTDVFRARLQVFIDQNATGVAEDGAFDLVAETGQNTLISRSIAGATQGANGACARPSISADGDSIAFESTATDGDPADDPLVASFVDVNGLSAADVYLRNVSTNVTRLVSRSFGTAGGNGASGRPAISPMGDAVAFETLADDFDFGDTNGEQDVFYALVDTSNTTVLALFRASVRSGGVQATGGASGRPAIWVDPLSGVVEVAFESAKTDLVGPLAGLPATSVYLHRATAPSVTRMLSRVSTAEQSLLPDGAASAPSFAPNGRWVAFETSATNLDTQRPGDANGSPDVLLVDLELVRADGTVAGTRLSLGAEGVDGAGASTAPLLAGFITTAGDFDVEALAAYTTQAANLGVSSDASTGAALTDRNLAFVVE